MHIGILMLIKVPKRVDHRARLLRCCSVIEINQRMTMCLFAQNWEVFTKGAPIHTGAGTFVHPVICSTRCSAPLLFEEIKEVKQLLTLAQLQKATPGCACVGGTRWPQGVGNNPALPLMLALSANI